MRIIIRYISLSLFIILPAISRGQADTLYFDHNWKPGTFDNAEYYRVIIPNSNIGYKIEDHYMKNDKIQMSGYCTTKSTETKNGAFVFYDDKGNKMQEEAIKTIWRTANGNTTMKTQTFSGIKIITKMEN